LIERLRKIPGKQVSCGATSHVKRSASGKLEIQTTTNFEFLPGQLAVRLSGIPQQICFATVKIECQVVAAERMIKTENIEWFDAAKVGSQILLRHWRPGDRFQPIGMGSAKKLQDIFANKKIDREVRRNLVVAEAATGEIFWVESVRISENFKVTQDTQEVLKWRAYR
jgi:tRNA(Ile)-lysidine synthetase-like protein